MEMKLTDSLIISCVTYTHPESQRLPAKPGWSERSGRQSVGDGMQRAWRETRSANERGQLARSARSVIDEVCRRAERVRLEGGRHRRVQQHGADVVVQSPKNELRATVLWQRVRVREAENGAERGRSGKLGCRIPCHC